MCLDEVFDLKSEKLMNIFLVVQVLQHYLEQLYLSGMYRVIREG